MLLQSSRSLLQSKLWHFELTTQRSENTDLSDIGALTGCNRLEQHGMINPELRCLIQECATPACNESSILSDLQLSTTGVFQCCPNIALTSDSYSRLCQEVFNPEGFDAT